MASFNPLGSILQKALSLVGWITRKVDEKERDDERHSLSRLREAERKADETGDTSDVESILRE